MNQTWENDKNLILGLVLACFGPNLFPENFFPGFYLYLMLDIVASYQCMQFQGKLMNRTWENCKKLSFGPNFGPNLVPKIFFVGFTSTTYYTLLQAIIPCNSKENQWTKLEKIVKKPNIESDFGPFGPNSSCQYFFFFFFKNLASAVTRYHGQLSSCTIKEKTNDPILRKVSDGRIDRQVDQSDFIGHCPTNVEWPI